jgi:predicted Ser/Thr protein kinase
MKNQPHKSNHPALARLGEELRKNEMRTPIGFREFLDLAVLHPHLVFRDIFQLFFDMVAFYLYEGKPAPTKNGLLEKESANFEELFIKNCDNPFFIDNLFANRFIKLTNGFKQGVQNNNIILFEGPPGSGKSTFLNNLLQKFEEYTRLPEGTMYQVHWRLDIKKLGGFQRLERHWHAVGEKNRKGVTDFEETFFAYNTSQEYLHVACPNHDHPILLIPKEYRKQFLDDLIPDEKFKRKLFFEKEYEWVLKDNPCTICSSLYETLLNIVGDPMEVFEMVAVRRGLFSRQYGEGISVFNPGDVAIEYPIKSPTTQSMLNDLLKSDDIPYIYSTLAKTNNGILTLMDIKENNIKRLMYLHGVISDGVHKVELIEERIKSLFVGLVNPADKEHYENMPSFQDRIITVSVPYILDYNTEVSIFRHRFGKGIDQYFLPGILENIAKIIISTRLNPDSPTIRGWVRNPHKYSRYLDEDLLLLKMEIYAGKTPTWLAEEDLKRLDAKTRKELLAEAEEEGYMGFSGRQSLNVFNNLFTKFSKSERLITMDMVESYFLKKGKLHEDIPDGFIESLVDMYDFTILQEIKEAMYSYNREKIGKDIQNYLYAINFEDEDEVFNPYTQENIPISEDYFYDFEIIVLGAGCSMIERAEFRTDARSEYVSTTLAQEISLEGKKITETRQFKSILDKYTHNLKENTLLPYLNNDNFRRAILDYGSNSFNSYDNRIRQDVNMLLENLQKKFKYTEEGAKQVCIYIIDKGLTEMY